MRSGLILLCLPLLPLLAEPATPPVFELYRATARIPASTMEGDGELILRAKGAGVELGKRTEAPKVQDATPAGATGSVEFKDIERLAINGHGVPTWRIPVHVSKLAGSGTFARTLTVTWGSDPQQKLSYSISNIAAPMVELKLSMLPAEWNASDSKCLRLRVAATGGRATGIGLTSTLTDAATKKALSSALSLSLDGQQPAAADDLAVAVNDTGTPLFLCLDSSFSASGTFAGNINISAAERPEGVTAALTIHHRTTNSIWRGSLLLGLGCALALVFRFLIPARRARDLAELPAALLRARIAEIDGLIRKRAGSPAPIPNISARIAESQNALSTEALVSAGCIPSRLGSLFGGVDAGKYKALLEGQSANILTLQILVADGVLQADKLRPPNPTVLASIDALATTPLPAPDTARTRVAAILAGAGPNAAPGGGASAERSPEAIVFSLEQGAYLTLLAWVVISFVSGYFVLILGRPGFGAPVDYLYCLLWSFGISTATAITTDPSQTALGIKLPPPV